MEKFSILVNVENIKKDSMYEEIKSFMIENNFMAEEDFREGVQKTYMGSLNSSHKAFKHVIDELTPIDENTSSIIYSKMLDYMNTAFGITYRVAIVDDKHYVNMFNGRMELKEVYNGYNPENIFDYDADIYVCIVLNGDILKHCYWKGNIIRPN